jgi:beta-glucosidase-like glycosyl hydrolase
MGSRARSTLHVAALAVLLLQLLPAPPHAAVAAAASEPPYTCGAGAPPNIPFCDRSLPIERRVADLVARMTVEEKISQLGDESPAVPRLGVPAYKWWSEALHGVSDHGRGVHLNGTLRAATSFPQVILTAASFNPHIWYRIGQVINAPAPAPALDRKRAGHARPAIVFSCAGVRRTTEQANVALFSDEV